jgi:hypothetical protein
MPLSLTCNGHANCAAAAAALPLRAAALNGKWAQLFDEGETVEERRQLLIDVNATADREINVTLLGRSAVGSFDPVRWPPRHASSRTKPIAKLPPTQKRQAIRIRLALNAPSHSAPSCTHGAAAVQTFSLGSAWLSCGTVDWLCGPLHSSQCRYTVGYSVAPQ